MPNERLGPHIDDVELEGDCGECCVPPIICTNVMCPGSETPRYLSVYFSTTGCSSSTFSWINGVVIETVVTVGAGDCSYTKTELIVSGGTTYQVTVNIFMTGSGTGTVQVNITNVTTSTFLGSFTFNEFNPGSGPITFTCNPILSNTSGCHTNFFRITVME